MKFKDYLLKIGACSEGRQFVGDQTFRQFWESCHRPDCMIWLMQKVNYQDDQMYRLFGCWCAANTPLADGRVTWDLLTDNRSRKAILVSIDFANGEATQEELAAAWDAARAAARDAAGDAQAKELRRRVDFKKLDRLVKKAMGKK